jgi:hypothetical protein
LVESELVFLAHIPLLRLEQESVPFREGDLWRMPFEHYDNITLGAFSDQQASYEETAPVFYRVMGNLDLTMLQPGQVDARGTIELKMPSDDRNFLHRLGLGFLANFHDMIVDRVWAALTLAAPAGTYPNPRLSTSTAISTGDASFVFDKKRSSLIRVQGDADQEYLFFAEAAGPPLKYEVVQQASALLDVVDRASQISELDAALLSLFTITSPSLSAFEQHTLSVIALEALLLPEVRSGLSKNFANRLSSLLARDSEHFARLQTLVSQLYKSRSAAVHGQQYLYFSSLDRKWIEYIDGAYAQQILAAAIVELTDKDRSEISWEKLRIDLDEIPTTFNSSNVSLPLANPPGLRRIERLTRRPSSIPATLFSSESAMYAEDGVLLSWSPLVGLGIENPFVFGIEDSPIIVPVSGSEIVSLEEKDIGRDFIAQLHISGKPIACLALEAKTDDLVDREDLLQQLLRKRDLAVIALRLSGFNAFHDPELLGLYIYEGRLRYRHPTVFRQTLLSMLRVEPKDIIQNESINQILSTWQMLISYDATARHPQIDNVLTTFRRVFDSRFIPIETRIGLMLSNIEAMLGRFRPKDDPIQLEHLVANLIGTRSEAVIWFNENGRQFRNSVVHGHWDLNREGRLPQAYLIEILQAIVPAFVSSWVNYDNRTGKKPSNVLIEATSKAAKIGSNSNTG